MDPVYVESQDQLSQSFTTDRTTTTSPISNSVPSLFSFHYLCSPVKRSNEFAMEACCPLIVNSIGTGNRFATDERLRSHLRRATKHVPSEMAFGGQNRKEWMRHVVHGFGGPSAATTHFDGLIFFLYRFIGNERSELINLESPHKK